MKAISFVLFCVLFTLNISAGGSALISNCSWTTESGNMIFHLNIDINECKNQTVSVIAYIHNSDGTKLSDQNNSYCTPDGQVAAHVDVTPKYDSSHWDDLQITIPNSELDPRPGNNSYYVNFEVHKNGVTIGRKSKACSYTMTGNSSSTSSSRSNSGGNYSSNNDKCWSCKGDRRCTLCHGSGQGDRIYLMGQWQTMPCLLCGGSGSCPSCYGTGKYYPPSGGNNYGGGNSSNYSGGSYNNGNNGSTVCSECGGLGCSKSVIYENDPSGAAFYPRELIRNREGNKCNICGRYTYHCHIKCTKCGNF